MVTPTDEKSSPKQPQISFALLRRQGAEHKVLLDITKPLKTTLQPWMYSPHRIYPVTVYIQISPWRPYRLKTLPQRQVMICSPRSH